MKNVETYDFVGHLVCPDVVEVRAVLFTESLRTVFTLKLGENEEHQGVQLNSGNTWIFEQIGYTVVPMKSVTYRSITKICDIPVYASFDKRSNEILVAVRAKDNKTLTDSVRKVKVCIYEQCGVIAEEETFTKMEMC